MFVVLKEDTYPRIMKNKHNNKLVLIYGKKNPMPHYEYYEFSYLDNISWKEQGDPNDFELVKEIITFSQQ